MTESNPNRPEAGPVHQQSRPPPEPPPPLTRFHHVAILVIVEGQHDIHFLRRISCTLNQQDRELPDLAAWELSGRLIFVPTAGGDLISWASRFAGFGVPEFHLYDREVPPETATRERATELVNRRSGCRAVLTGKRGTENYLHGTAIQQARGIELSFGDFDDVPDLAAQHCYSLRHESVTWSDLPFRTRKRL